jgi:flagellar biosynthetic protein FlhB
MADAPDREDQTEAASQQRLLRAREEGRAPLSRELAHLCVLAAATTLLTLTTPATLRTATGELAGLLSNAHLLGSPPALGVAARCLALVAGPFVLAAMVVGSLAVLLQTGGVLRLQALQPDLARLDPRTGLARLFGSKTAIETGKSLLKLVVVGGAGVLALRHSVPVLTASLQRTPGGLAASISQQVVQVLIAMLGAHGVLTVLDVVRSRFSFAADLRMSRQELRDESKDNDGNPVVKGRLRRIRQQRARRRMMAAVPKATVIVTNPTHYAVALAYERGQGGSPRVVAKGVDDMAARIREIAEASRVPLVANPPLARALYTCKLDSEIPAEHFKVVAEIIAYVWRLKGIRR